MHELDQSYLWCRTLCRHSRSSFYSSFALLEPERRKAMFALYAFARISDNLSDRNTPAELRHSELNAWRSQLSALSGVSSVTKPELELFPGLWPALGDTIARFDIPLNLLQDVVTGVWMDVEHHQPADWADLKRYCYHVASAVGLACTQIWRAKVEVPREATIQCGYAFQLTNMLRDVAEDAQMGRVYLPQSLFQKHEVARDRWLEGRPNGDWQALIMEVADEAYALYDRGWTIIGYLTPRSQRMFSLMWRSYRSLLDEVLANRSDLWQASRVCLPARRRFNLVAAHFVLPLYTRLPAPCLSR